VEITKETVREMKHGWQVVGIERIEITPLDLYLYKGILLTCPGTQYDGSGNAKPVWVGGHRVTADDNPGTGGFPIMPGSAMFIPIEKPNEIWVISSQADQRIAWMVV
jgi:hypothetical protein